MSRRAISIVAVVVLVATAGAVWLLQDREASPAVDADRPAGEAARTGGTAADERVRVSSPRPNAVVSSPLAVRGEARGTWYFEADFPIRLLEGDGRELAVTPAPAEGEWMTEGFVPFDARLSFEAPATQAGLLVLERANPSGLAEHAALVALPVRFSESAPRATAVRTFFSRSASGDDPCEAVWPVARAVAPTEDEARAAVTELLAGPTPAERDRGYFTSLPEDVVLRSLRIENGFAHADFDATLNQAAGSCRVLAIRAQIERTLLRLPTVEDVVISVEGNVEEALQP
jgi:hypothetical protein